MKNAVKRAVLLALALAVLVLCTACPKPDDLNTVGGGGDTEPVTPSVQVDEFDGLTPEEVNRMGVDAVNAGDTEKALRCWEWAAAQGDAAALENLGAHYYYASAESEEPQKTEYWEKSRNYNEQAAAQGDGHAFYNLGLLYHYIDGHTDYEKALEYYDQAAALGHEQAAANAARLREQLNQ